MEARLSPFLAGMVGGRDASSLPAAQMSLPYAVAARIAFGTAGLPTYAPERRADPRQRALVDRVVVVVDEGVTASDRAAVTVVLRDGTRLEEATATALGAPSNPSDEPRLIRKFDELVGLVLPRTQVRCLAEACLALDEVTDMGSLVSLLRVAHEEASNRLSADPEIASWPVARPT